MHDYLPLNANSHLCTLLGFSSYCQFVRYRISEKPLTSGKSAQKQELTISDVTNQSRQLMVHFIHDRMVADGFTHPLANGELIAAGTPTGLSIKHYVAYHIVYNICARSL